MIKNTILACDRSGMLYEHARNFQQVANTQNCVIACRSVGKWATGLIRESYASKGFHVKAKSSNWGPMAGFVMGDPRFSKNGSSHVAAAAQELKIRSAIADGAMTTPLYISDHRRQALENAPLSTIEFVPGRSHPGIRCYDARDPSGGTMEFVLEQDTNCPPNTWRVCYGHHETIMGPGTIEGRRNRFERPEAYAPIMALTNPGANPRLYKSALTGDYDLWGAYPKQEDYDRNGIDARPVPDSDYSVRLLPVIQAFEDPDVGNITQRISIIRGELNAAIRSSGYFGSDMVHHSDELGRPFVDDVELEFIAFFPQQDFRARFVNSMSDFQIFAADARQNGFREAYNPGWKLFHNYNRVLDGINPNRILNNTSTFYR